MLRLSDPTDNKGRGWRQLTDEELTGIIWMALRLTTRGTRSAFAGRNASASDEAVRAMAAAVWERLRLYPVSAFFVRAFDLEDASCSGSWFSPMRLQRTQGSL
jgi:hypothetical protein